MDDPWDWGYRAGVYGGAAAGLWIGAMLEAGWWTVALVVPALVASAFCLAKSVMLIDDGEG